METGHTILTRGLPKTGQVTEYIAGDDGTHQAGWWLGRKQAANRERFIVKTLDGDDVVIDLATGLMWPKDVTGNGANSGTLDEWSVHLAYANGLTFAGFSDWRMPNVIELFTLMDFLVGTPAWPSVFINQQTAYFWTSTTDISSASEAYMISPNIPQLTSDLKAVANFRLLCCRGGM